MLPFEIRQTVQLVDAFDKSDIKQDEYKQFNIKETNVLLRNSYKKLSLYHFFSQRMKTALVMKNTMNTIGLSLVLD